MILNTVAVTFGMVVAYVIDYIFAFYGAWRWMLGTGLVPAIIMGALLIFLPQSPRWLMKKGRTKKAWSILSRIRNNADVAKGELKDIRQILFEEKRYKKYSLLALYRSHFGLFYY